MNHEPTDQHVMEAALHEAAAFEKKAYRRRWLVAALGFPLVGVFLLFAAVKSTQLKREFDALELKYKDKKVEFDRKETELEGLRKTEEGLIANVATLNGQRDAAQQEAKTEKSSVAELTTQRTNLTTQVEKAKTALSDVEKKLAAKEAITEQAVAVSKETVQRTINLLSPLIEQLRSGTNITLTRFTEIRKQAGADEEALKKLDEIVKLLRQVDTDPTSLDPVKALLAEIKRPDDAPARTVTGPLPPGSGKSVQFLLNQNDDTTAGKQRKLAEANAFATTLGYTIESGRTDIGRSPVTTEVRYYHHPEDRAAAEAFLKALKAKFGFSSGRVSYVIDEEQPLGALQVSLAVGALGPSSVPPPPPDWAVQVGFHGAFTGVSLARVTDRQADVQKVVPGRNLKAMIVARHDNFYLLLGCSPDKSSAEALFADLEKNGKAIMAEFIKRGGLHWGVPKLRVIQISTEFGNLARGSDGIYRVR